MRIDFPAEKIQVEEKKVSAIFWENKVKVLSIVFISISLGLVALKMSLKSPRLLKDFFIAGSELHSFQKEGEIDGELVAKIVHKHPELNPLFQHVLIDQKIFQGEVESAKTLVIDSLQRMEFVDPVYTSYTRSSILIEEGRYSAALNETSSLVEKMRAIGWEQYPKMYVFSLLRVGMLSLVAGERERAKEAFKEAKELLLGDNSKISHEVQDQLISHLNSDQLSFFDFVQKEIGEK
jgi:hypothetical protein